MSTIPKSTIVHNGFLIQEFDDGKFRVGTLDANPKKWMSANSLLQAKNIIDSGEAKKQLKNWDDLTQSFGVIYAITKCVT